MHYISLGYFCSIAIELEQLGLRTESSPFDWVISDFEGIINALQYHFKDFLEYDYLKQSIQNRAHYKNTKYNVAFFHDFDRYIPLKEQLPDVQKKYNRRIERFYKSISQPTLFIRYISDEHKIGNVSKELLWIEENYELIINTLKCFNPSNDILFIANEGVTSKKIEIYNVTKDDNDIVARNPISQNPILSQKFNDITLPNKQQNIERYIQKKKREKKLRIKKYIISAFKKKFIKEYIHPNQY